VSALGVAEALRRAAGYPHAVLSWVGTDGYPVAVAGAVRAEPDAGRLEIGPVVLPVPLPEGGEVCVTCSHIRPRPGEGYDERRYVTCWGRVEGPAAGAADPEVARPVTVQVRRAAGWDEAETPFFEYAERNVAQARAEFERRGQRPRLPLGWTIFLAARLPFLTATAVPVGLGGAVAAHDGRFHWGWFLVALVAGLAVHVGLNVANDLFDDRNGADAANTTPTPFSGGSRVLQYGLVTRSQMLALAAGAYTVAVGLGLWLAWARSPWLLAVGASGILLSFVYSMPPFQLVHRGLGEPVTALGFGPVMVAGSYLACAGRWSWEAVYASLPVAILVALVLFVNEVPDRHADARVGKRTLVVRWPARRVIAAYDVAVATAFLLVLVGPLLGITPPATWLALAGVPFAGPVRRGLRRHYDEPYALMGAMQTNIALHLVTGSLLAAGYVLATALG